MSSTVEHRDRRRPTPASRRRPWVGLLALLVVAFLFVVWPPYLTLDRTLSRIPLNPDPGHIHYALVVAHIFFGSVALIAGILQLWPWLRRGHPRTHRAVGRIYVFGGMLPAAVGALVMMPMGALNTLGMIGTAIWAVLALSTTFLAVRAARRRRYDEHRRWMIYSFALALAPISSRLWFFLLLAVVPGAENMIGLVGIVGAFWLNWIGNLALAHWRVRRIPVLARR
ncbi:DUF2306 domain-containing protein [Rhizohabitans arisaemae]|uniref:DUF2306 domain-containing protein n=1 Tax=Rhizohabitans arisaemae TaxID=2720610 RepID=UPI0024B12514|nr:DUF2306 domain-containing protein [Rhizohabitans arisaemae]